MTAPEQLVHKLRNTRNILRDDGRSFRLFLKRAEDPAGRRGLLASAGFAGKLA
ncbi:MAG: hypothetical protein PHG96_04790 [Kiritimatiellae bacterium]|nr:hypothetical protein [Kiritimatiellia bacterium]MDD4024995.1 hypothetical protein [Kiritimatiellia bacterium]